MLTPGTRIADRVEYQILEHTLTPTQNPIQPQQLKIEVQPHLDNPRRIQLRTQRAERLRRLQAYRRIGKLHGVERSEELRTEGGAPSFRELEFARERHVQIPA